MRRGFIVTCCLLVGKSIRIRETAGIISRRARRFRRMPSPLTSIPLHMQTCKHGSSHRATLSALAESVNIRHVAGLAMPSRLSACAVPRSLPSNCNARLLVSTPPRPPLLSWLRASWRIAVGSA